VVLGAMAAPVSAYAQAWPTIRLVVPYPPAGSTDVMARLVQPELQRRLALTDLSPLPRTGFKGTGTVEWLTAQGMTIGPDSNMAYRQADGSLAARRRCAIYSK